ncbi:WD40 domain-containing protein [Coleofasciculus sp. E1-EBD-02]|uniref:WD40 domain-containing protein n=1 Tax=Coleofasciculus sp. E1-EBD-02 TaxID=3068481 RepID=UPI0033051C43
MNELYQPDESADYENSLADLAWAIESSLGEFSLILARCNFVSWQAQMVQQLQGLVSVKIRVIQLQASVKRLYQRIQAELGDEQPAALMILGLDAVEDIDYLLTAANQVREEFRKNFHFPIVWWVNDEVLQKLIRLAPDFESWATITEFAIASDTLSDFLWKQMERVFTAVLEAGGSEFLSNEAILGTGYRLELDSASSGLHLKPSLNASLQFVLGRADYESDRIDQALTRYQQSLQFWQQGGDSTRNSKLRAGLVLFHIGLCYCRQAELERRERQHHWQEALRYFQQGMEVFESPELMAKFINQSAQVLQHLESWDELQRLAEKSITLHQTYGTLVLLAQDYGFLAEVALARSKGQNAHKLAQQALQLLDQVPIQQRRHQGLYLLLLGRSQQQLGQLDLAVRSLERARSGSHAQDNPPRYIQILEQLRSLYFEQGNYLKAFHVKQDQRLIERQYGFRAFIGASRLQSPVIESIPSEITASGRQQDVKRLIERISSTQHKLTVIYGQSGVGKSSVLEAGLVPALKQQVINTRDPLPIYIRVYTDWVRMLGQNLAKGLGEQEIETPLMESLTREGDSAAILEQLQDNESRNLLTVLIFDQLEEFFFSWQDSDQRRLFFEFMRDCLNVPFVKVILSLREDYLHLILDGCRRTKLEAINNNILDKDILFYFGNFSPDDARAIIYSLTENSQFHLETALINRLVKELAAEVGEVRPIELQVVGAQLQTDSITTLEKYHQVGSKERLVERYLEEIIHDCGDENKSTAELVLYLLTDENGTRPLKTRGELAADLTLADNLDLVLEILVTSGLVFEIPESPANRYQLVHDYLVEFIRQQQKAENLAELKREKEQRLLAEAQLKRVEQANRILEDAKRKATQRIQTSSTVMAFSILGLVSISVWATQASVKLNDSLTQINQKEIALTKADEERKAAQLETQEIQQNLQAAQTNLVQVTQDVQNKSSQLKKADRKEKEAQQRLKIATQRATEAEQGLQQVTQKEQEVRQGLQRVTQKEKEARQRLQTATKEKTEAQAEAERAQREQQQAERAFEQAQAKRQQAETEYNLAQKKLDEAEVGRQLEQVSTLALQQFQSGELAALLAVMRSGRELQKLVQDGRSLQDYPAVGPVRALQSILENIRERNQLQGHRGWVMSASFSPDGKYIATAGEDGIAKLWSSSGQLIKELTGHQDKIWSVRFSPNGQYIATVSTDGTVKLWDISGQLIKEWNTNQSAILSVNFSPDGQYLATAGESGTGILWNLSGEQIGEPFGEHQNSVTSIRFSPDGQQIATAGEDGTVQLWNLSGQKISELSTTGDSQAIFSVSFSPDGQYLTTAEEDGIVRLWDLSKKQFVRLTGHQGLVLSVSFSSDGTYIATAGEDGTTRLWDLSGQQISEPFRGHLGAVLSVSFSPDGQQIITAGSDGIARLWNVSKPKIARFDSEFTTNQNGTTSINFSPDGHKIVTAGVNGTIKIWNLSEQEIYRFKAHQGTIWDVSFSSDGKYIATAGEDGIARLWNFSGEELAKLDGHSGWVTSVHFSPDGKYIATAGEDGITQLWNFSGEALTNLDSQQGRIFAVRFSPDSKQIITIGEDSIVKVWNLSGQQIQKLEGHQNAILSLSFSMEGNYIATASADGTARLWNYNSGQQITEFKGHQGWVSSVSFSPELEIVTAGEDGTVRLWNHFGQPIAKLKGDIGKIMSVSFSPDGQRIAAVGENGRVKLWRLEQFGLDKLLEQGCDWLQDYIVTHPEFSEVCLNN